ncbi:FAD binding domain-containing protein [Bradyrhizobium cenepequi]
MQAFAYARAAGVTEALAAARNADTAFLAGGTELLNWMRLGIAAPTRILDITRLAGFDAIETLPDGGLRFGALARLNDVALAPAVVERAPMLSQAILSAASPQIRNLATIGGNLLQKTRCGYFRAEEKLPCNKKWPGTGCAARDGLNDRHAIFGWSDTCVATQPSDPAVALAALDASVITARGAGGRRIPVTEFYRLPDADLAGDTVLEQGELITTIEIPGAAPRSTYIKVRERESYEFATASVAIALDLDAGRRIARARIALGSVALRPWRLVAAEEALAGLQPDSSAIAAAVETGFAEARPLAHNAYKITLGRNLVLRALRLASEMAP